MKKTVIFLILAIAILLFLFFMPTKQNNDNSNIWNDATYTKDISLGSGEKTLFVEVVALDKSVTFTINTDKETVGDALLEHNLVSGDKGAYGLYVKVVNGIEADYEKDKSYWAFTKNKESMTVGVDMAKFENEEHYELVYTK